MIIKLINPPPASLKWPSIGLTQLKAKLIEQFPQEVSVNIEYLNFPFGRFIGAEPYDLFTRSRLGKGYGYLEWYFQNVAFPGCEDTQAEFLKAEGLDFLRSVAGCEAQENLDKIFWANKLLYKRPQLEAFIDQVIHDHGLVEADVVGFSSMFNQNLAVLAFARRIKHYNPKVMVVVGGCNCESPMGEELTRNFDCFDFIFSGPSLVSFPRFVRGLLDDKPEELHLIHGVFSRQNLDQVVYIPQKKDAPPHIKNLGEALSLDEVMPLDYDDFLQIRAEYSDMDLPDPGLFFESSRGCWWGEKAHCTFCGVNAGTMAYQQSAKASAQLQIENLVNKYGKDVRYFAAVDNIMPQQFPKDVFPELRLDHRVDIFYEVKSDISYEELSLMKAAGVSSIQPGIESFNSRLLKQMKKGVTSTRNIQFLKDTTQIGMNVLWNILIGFPGETEDHYHHLESSIPQLTHLYPLNLFGAVGFVRYSPYHTYAKTHGLSLRPSKGMEIMYPSVPLSSLENMAYFFDDITEPAQYKENRKKWFPILSPLVQYWQSRWFGDMPGELPELYLSADRSQVTDTRTDKKLVHELQPVESQLLDFLSVPRSIGKISNWLGMQGGSEQHLRRLMEAGLLFHDQETTFISLVFDAPLQRPKPSELYSFY